MLRAWPGFARALGSVGMVSIMVGVLAGAGAAQSPSEPPAPVPRGVVGTWAGVIDAPTGRIELTFRLGQDGERVFGIYDYRGPVLVALNVRITGLFRGDALTLFEEGAAEPLLDARVAGKAFTGHFRGSGQPITASRTD